MQHFQSHPDIGHGVNHVGADDEIIATGFEILVGRRLFEVEHLVFHLRECREFLIRSREESGRNVGESVVVDSTV